MPHDLVEGGRPLGGEDPLVDLRWGAMWEREFEVLGHQLLDVWSTYIIRLLDLNDLENLCVVFALAHCQNRGISLAVVEVFCCQRWHLRGWS